MTLMVGRTPLPPHEHLLRYASGGFFDDGVLSGTAFRPRPGDGGELSVNRLGILDPANAPDIAAVRDMMAAWMTLRRSGRLIESSVEIITDCAVEAGASFGFFSDPRAEQGKPDDPSHALITGIPAGDDDGAVALRDMIAIRHLALHPAVL